VRDVERRQQMRAEDFGLKASYEFKQTHIPTSHRRDDILRQLRDTVSPAVRELESRRLINGYHHIVHQEIDLRLSCGDWSQHEPDIRTTLEAHSISPELTEWGPMPPERYGGDIGVVLCCNNLEFNSRLCLALAELMDETCDPSTQQMQERLCPHQWVHYLCNQFGYLNWDQIVFEVNDALVWLQSMITRHRDHPQVLSDARRIVESLRQAVDEFEDRWLSGRETPVGG
jgi:hypothetical protein